MVKLQLMCKIGKGETPTVQCRNNTHLFSHLQHLVVQGLILSSCPQILLLKAKCVFVVILGLRLHFANYLL